MIVFAVILIHVAKETPPHICGLDGGYPCSYWEKVREISSYIGFFIFLFVFPLGIFGLIPFFLILWLRKRKKHHSNLE
jgi:hypothetical protein